MPQAFRDKSAGAHNVAVTCLKCGSRHHLSDMLCDLDGPAFRAYYCPQCFPWPEGSRRLAGRSEWNGRITWFDPVARDRWHRDIQRAAGEQ